MVPRVSWNSALTQTWGEFVYNNAQIQAHAWSKHGPVTCHRFACRVMKKYLASMQVFFIFCEHFPCNLACNNACTISGLQALLQAPPEMVQAFLHTLPEMVQALVRALPEMAHCNNACTISGSACNNARTVSGNAGNNACTMSENKNRHLFSKSRKNDGVGNRTPGWSFAELAVDHLTTAPSY